MKMVRCQGKVYCRLAKKPYKAHFSKTNCVARESECFPVETFMKESGKMVCWKVLANTRLKLRPTRATSSTILKTAMGS